MNIALLLENEQLCNLDKNLGYRKIKAVIFAVDKNKYIRGQVDYLFHQSIGYLSLWIVSKQIKVIFVSCIDPEIKTLVTKLGSLVKEKDELENDPFFGNIDLSLL